MFINVRVPAQSAEKKIIKLPNLDGLKTRVIETADMDRKHLLRPLLLFKGSQTEGRIRSLFNLVLAMMDADVDSVTDAVKLGHSGDFRHLCGVHAAPAHTTFSSILGRLYMRRDVADLIPGLWEYVQFLGRNKAPAHGYLHILDPIPEYALRVRSSRSWRLMPRDLRPHKEKPPVLPEFYPYISGNPSDEHDMLLAVDRIVPRGLPNSMRCDLCQDMLVAVLSGDTTVDNLKGDLPKYLKQFWAMFPDKYGHVSLDAPVFGTEDMAWNDKLNAKTSRLIR